MPTNSAAPFLVLLALQLTFLLPPPEERALDLSVQPEDVEGAPRPPARLDLESSPPAWRPAATGQPGWSVRPEIELDLEGAFEGEPALRSLDPALESLGLRLKRTW